jgi:hypothetical protein
MDNERRQRDVGPLSTADVRKAKELGFEPRSLLNPCLPTAAMEGVCRRMAASSTPSANAEASSDAGVEICSTRPAPTGLIAAPTTGFAADDEIARMAPAPVREIRYRLGPH